MISAVYAFRCSQLPVTLNAQDPQRRFSRKSTQWQNRIDVIGISALLYEALLTFYGKLLDLFPLITL